MRSELGPQSAGASDKISPCRAESLGNQLENCFAHIRAVLKLFKHQRPVENFDGTIRTKFGFVHGPC